MKVCSVEGCDRAVVIASRGWCRAHYNRWWRDGDVRAETPLRVSSLRWGNACGRGHPWQAGTTRVRPEGRECKVCARERWKMRYVSDEEFRQAALVSNAGWYHTLRAKARVLDAMLEEMGLTWEEFMEDQDVSA